MQGLPSAIPQLLNKRDVWTPPAPKIKSYTGDGGRSGWGGRVGWRRSNHGKVSSLLHQVAAIKISGKSECQHFATLMLSPMYADQDDNDETLADTRTTTTLAELNFRFSPQFTINETSSRCHHRHHHH